MFVECRVAVDVNVVVAGKAVCIGVSSDCLVRRVGSGWLLSRDQGTRPVWQPVERQHPRRHRQLGVEVRLWMPWGEFECECVCSGLGSVHWRMRRLFGEAGWEWLVVVP